MLLVAGVTAASNLLLRDGKMLHAAGKYFFRYEEDDMGTTIPQGSFVIAEDAVQVDQLNAVIYRSTSGKDRIALVSLKLDHGEDNNSAAVYYLTSMTDTEPIAVSPSDIIGVCKSRSHEIGAIIGFLNSLPGLVICLILPCLIMLLYMIAGIVAAQERAKDAALVADDADDIEFVKSIQQRQQKAAERDAKRSEEQSPAQKHAAEPVDEEQLKREEEEEAARRAERIAAVRSHMETRRETETPDGVPLYTTEFITKTHTMPIPKVGDKLTTTQQRAAVRVSATGQIQQEGGKAVRQSAKTETPVTLSEPERLPVHPKRTAAQPVEETKPTAPIAAEKPVPAPISEKKPAPVPAEEKREPVSAPAPKPAAAEPIAKPADVKPAPKPAPAPAQPKESDATFDEVWAMLEAEEQKLLS